VEARTNTSLFVFPRGHGIAYLMLYVDDIVLTAFSTPIRSHIYGAIQCEFSKKDVGKLHFLGMHVQHTAYGLYMLNILCRARMAGCKPCSNTIDLNLKLFVDGYPISNPTDFHSLFGALTGVSSYA
jgi:hypothetical protein